MLGYYTVLFKDCIFIHWHVKLIDLFFITGEAMICSISQVNQWFILCHRWMTVNQWCILCHRWSNDLFYITGEGRRDCTEDKGSEEAPETDNGYFHLLPVCSYIFVLVFL